MATVNTFLVPLVKVISQTFTNYFDEMRGKYGTIVVVVEEACEVEDSCNFQ
jgi:hypothetical protein